MTSQGNLLDAVRSSEAAVSLTKCMLDTLLPLPATENRESRCLFCQSQMLPRNEPSSSRIGGNSPNVVRFIGHGEMRLKCMELQYRRPRVVMQYPKTLCPRLYDYMGLAQAIRKPLALTGRTIFGPRRL